MNAINKYNKETIKKPIDIFPNHSPIKMAKDMEINKIKINKSHI
jgi:hypothetical protein